MAKHKAKQAAGEALICIECPESKFLDPKKEICYKTGGLWCKRLKAIVGKYESCMAKPPSRKKSAGGRG